MKTIEFYLNLVHFCCYKAHYKIHLIVNKANPFRLLVKIPFIKRRLEMKGIKNIQNEIDAAFGDKNFGLSTTFSGGFLSGIIFVLFFSINNILIGLSKKKIELSITHFFILFLISGIVSYFFIFKKDVYLNYFIKFEKWSKTDERKYCWMTLGFILTVFSLFLFSFKFA